MSSNTQPETTPAPAKRGRPRKYSVVAKAPTIEGKIEEMASYSLSVEEIASILDLTRDAIYKNPIYYTALKIGQHNCDASLRRRQFVEAMKGNTAMLIWLGKQRLHQKDKQEIGGIDGKPIPITLDAAKASLVDFLTELSKREQQPERVQ